MCQLCANSTVGVDDRLARHIVAGMVIGELEGGGFASVPGFRSGRQTGDESPPTPAGAEGLGCSAKKHHAPDAGHGGPAPISLGLSHQGARMRPKKTSLRHVKELPYPTRTRTTFEVPAENG